MSQSGQPAARLVALLRGPLPVAALLAVHLALGLSAVAKKCATFDEGVHLAGGFSYWSRADYRLHSENGHWSQRWAALPVWLLGYEFPDTGDRSWQTSDLWGVADKFFYELNDADRMLLRGRTMIGVASSVLGLLVYLWARQLFGPWGGLISLTLYAFSPTMLTHGFLVTSDLCVSLFFTAAIWALWTMLARVSPRTVALSCLTLAGVLLAKFSGVLIIPMGLLLLGIRLANPRPLAVAFGQPREVHGRWRQLAVFVAVLPVLVVGVASIIWTSYGFRYSMMSPSATANDQKLVDWDKLSTNSKAIDATVAVARDHHLLPEAYLWGFTYMLASTKARPAFLNGEFSPKGWVSYFPWCLAVKTPLAVFVILIVAAAGGWYFRKGALAEKPPPGALATGLYDVAPLLVLLAVYWLVAMRSNLNIGHRHLLPTYPAMFILAGAAARWFARSPQRVWPRTDLSRRGKAKPAPTAPANPALTWAMRWTVVAALAISAVETVWWWPHYLAYFSRVAGPPERSYRRLVDSSLDWGQDLPDLKKWLDLWLVAHPQPADQPPRVYLAYFGVGRPDYYGINAQVLPCFHTRWRPHVPQPLTGGVYCISATMLDSVYTMFPGRWNRAYEEYYRTLRTKMGEFYGEGGDAAAASKVFPRMSSVELGNIFYQYEEARFNRLCSYLRSREPDAEINYSILIYELDDADIKDALELPAREMLAKPEIQP
ncbi:MAG: glycosyltransferase family 39 protein [Planctomycetia bacterium]|nr:glycosyltransferase family 39 protein [Planctomycetia bacterium]